HSHQLFESRRRSNKVLVEPALKDRTQQAFDRDDEPQILLESGLAAGGQDKERRRDLSGGTSMVVQGGKPEQASSPGVLIGFDEERLFRLPGDAQVQGGGYGRLANPALTDKETPAFVAGCRWRSNW